MLIDKLKEVLDNQALSPMNQLTFKQRVEPFDQCPPTNNCQSPVNLYGRTSSKVRRELPFPYIVRPRLVFNHKNPSRWITNQSVIPSASIRNLDCILLRPILISHQHRDKRAFLLQNRANLGLDAAHRLKGRERWNDVDR